MSKNIAFDRQRFEKVANFYRGFGLVPQTNQLRFLTKFKNGNGNYRFNVGDTGIVNPHVLARHLKRNDAFIAKSISAAIYIEKDAKPGTGIILPYPVLDSAATPVLPTGYSGMSSADIEALYNGIMTLKTGQTMNYMGFPLDSFRRVPETQPTADLMVLPEYKIEEIQFDLPEVLKFVGTSDQYLGIEFPATPDMVFGAAQAGFSAYLMIKVDGWLIEGGTNPDLKIPENPLYAAL